MLAAPVSGNAKVVKAGKLTFAVSGPEAAFATVRPYFDALGTGAAWVGEGEVARIVKICHNVFLGVVTQSLAEVTVLAQKAGIPRHAFLDFMNKSVMGSVFSQYKTPAMVNLDFHVTFTPELLRKDLDLGLSAGRALEVPMPVAALTREIVQAMIGNGYADLDFSALLAQEASQARGLLAQAQAMERGLAALGSEENQNPDAAGFQEIGSGLSNYGNAYDKTDLATTPPAPGAGAASRRRAAPALPGGRRLQRALLGVGAERLAARAGGAQFAVRARGDVVYLNTVFTGNQNQQQGPGGSGEGILYLDADLTGYGVTFYHQREIDRNGGQKSCVLCHHMNMPHDQNSGCYECHRDMYLPSDAFRHEWHASPSGANLACVQCHAQGQTRSAANVKSCTDCHKDLVPAGATIKIKTYMAPAYVDAMHQLCIGCHAKVAKQQNKPQIARCAECHRGKLDFSDAENLLYRRRALAGRGVVLPPETTK